MKKILHTALILTLLFITGCQGLEETTYSVYQSKNFFKNKTELQAANLNIYALYAAAMAWERTFHIVGTTQCKYTVSNNNLFTTCLMHTVDASKAEFYNLWSLYYRAINLANDVIANADKADAPDDFIKQHIAEARLLRAFSYYQLTVLWGDVPLHLTPTVNPGDVDLPRSPVGKVMDAVVDDLNYAVEYLPIKWDIKGRAAKKAAIFLKGKVLLQMAGKPLYKQGMYEQIIETMEDLMEKPSQYDAALLTDVTQVFSNTNKNNQEVLLVWSSERDSYGSQIPYLLLPANSNQYGTSNNNAPGWLGMSGALYKLFESADARRSFLHYTYTNKSGGKATYDATSGYGISTGRGIGIGKYTDPLATGVNAAVNDKIVYRFAEAYLIYAEAYNESDEPDKAAHYLNVVRDRAGATLFPETGNTKEGMRVAIRKERYLELFSEWSEIFDMRRLGEEAEHWKEQHYINDYFNVANPGSAIDTDNYDPKWDLFPIPVREINFNKEIDKNNPGW